MIPQPEREAQCVSVRWSRRRAESNHPSAPVSVSLLLVSQLLTDATQLHCSSQILKHISQLLQCGGRHNPSLWLGPAQRRAKCGLIHFLTSVVWSQIWPEAYIQTTPGPGFGPGPVLKLIHVHSGSATGSSSGSITGPGPAPSPASSSGFASCTGSGCGPGSGPGIYPASAPGTGTIPILVLLPVAIPVLVPVLVWVLAPVTVQVRVSCPGTGAGSGSRSGSSSGPSTDINLPLQFKTEFTNE